MTILQQNALFTIVTHNFPPETVGGASRVYELCKMLKEKYELTVLCPPPTFPFTAFPRFKGIIRFEKLDDINVIRILTYQPKKLNPNFTERILYYLIFPILCCLMIIYLSAVKKIHYILTSTPPLTTILPGLLCRSLGLKWILDIRDLWLYASISLGYINRNSFLFKLARKFETISIVKSDIIFVNSPTISDYVKIELPKPEWNKIFFVPFSVDTSLFKPRNSHNKKETIIYVGNFGSAQSLETAIRAMSEVSKFFPKLKFILVGKGEEEGKLKKIRDKLNLKNVIFMDPIPRSKIPELLSQALIGIVPLKNDRSLKYARPTKLYEYLSCGLPVVAYGSSLEVKRIIMESEAGIYVNGNDPTDVAKAIITLLSNPELLKKMSYNARRYIIQNYDSKIVSKKLSNILSSIQN